MFSLLLFFLLFSHFSSFLFLFCSKLPQLFLRPVLHHGQSCGFCRLFSEVVAGVCVVHCIQPHLLEEFLHQSLTWFSIVARAEYRKHYLTRIFGSPHNGCYFLAFTIFTLGIARDHVYQLALADQPYYAPVHQPLLGGALFGFGSILVLSSMWALGVTGTYLGDYFGILMDAPVTGFPFNVTGSPMYWGSTLNFLGVALYQGKVAGILLTAQVFVLYWFALRWEDPFTAEIYAKRDRERSKTQ